MSAPPATIVVLLISRPEGSAVKVVPLIVRTEVEWKGG